MLYLNKLLKCVKKHPELFTLKNAGYITGLTTTQIRDLKQFALKNGLICRTEKRNHYCLTEIGDKYLEENPVEINENSPDTNLEYLKSAQMPSCVTRAIRQLSKHMIDNEEIKEESIENYIKKEIFEENPRFKKIINELEKCIFLGEKPVQSVNLEKLFNKFISSKITKSIFSVILMYILIKNQKYIAIYELGQFQLKLTPLVFDRMIHAAKNFELKIIKQNESKKLKELSKAVLPKSDTDMIKMTSSLMHIMKSLEKYTHTTSDLDKKIIKLRNSIMNSKDPVKLFFHDIPKALQGKELEECDKEIAVEFENAILTLQNCYTNLISELENYMLNNFNAKSIEELTKRFESVKEYLNSDSLKILYNNLPKDYCDNFKTVEKIAAYVNGSRVPKDWDDNDKADFKLKVKELAAKFKIIEAVAGKELNTDKTVEKIIKQIEKLNDTQKLFLLKSVV